MPTAWSFSVIKTFEQCPRKYYHLRVVKDTKDEKIEATIYGEEVHAAAEAYIKDGIPVPEKYGIIKSAVEAFDNYPGTRYAELKLGVGRTDDGTYYPCEFFDNDVWYRGIVDLLIVDNDRAWMVDWKTGKNSRYADMRQLDLMAAAVFTHFPNVRMIKSALVFLVPNEFLSKKHYRANRKEYWEVFRPQLDRLETAMQTGIFNAKTSGLCRQHCPVLSCEHNGRSK